LQPALNLSERKEKGKQAGLSETRLKRVWSDSPIRVGLKWIQVRSTEPDPNRTLQADQIRPCRRWCQRLTRWRHRSTLDEPTTSSQVTSAESCWWHRLVFKPSLLTHFKSSTIHPGVHCRLVWRPIRVPTEALIRSWVPEVRQEFCSFWIANLASTNNYLVPVLLQQKKRFLDNFCVLCIEFSLWAFTFVVNI